MLTREERQGIIQDYAQRHGGIYHPADFVEEVRKAGESHPAFEWFEWDDDIAGQHHRVWQARMFSIRLKIRFSIPNVKSTKVKINYLPFVTSSVSERSDGGGYFIVDPDNPEHMEELCRQATSDLERWLKRYESSLVYAGGSAAWLNRTLKKLRLVYENKELTS